MGMTPNEILTKQFSKVMSGYRAEEVNAFLAQVAQCVEDLQEEKTVLEEKMLVLADKLEEYREEEDSLRAVLIGAQKLGDSVMRDSRKKAAETLQEAQEQADAMLAEARRSVEETSADLKKSVERERDVLYKLKAEVARFKSRIHELYAKHIAVLNEIDVDEKDFPLTEPERDIAPEPAELPLAEPVAAVAAEKLPAQKKDFVVQIDGEPGFDTAPAEPAPRQPGRGGRNLTEFFNPGSPLERNERK
jgi:DivIVA domain-containing protein